MKILQIINSLGSGGAEKLIDDMVPLMNKTDGIEVEVLLLTNEKNVFGKNLKENNVTVTTLSRKNMRSLLNIIDIIKFIKKGSYDIVHAHLFPTFYWTSISSRFIYSNKPKFIFTEHSTHNRRREKFYFKYIDKFMYSCFDRIISISQQTQDELIKWLRIKQKDKKKFIIIENGVNIKKFNTAKPYLKSELVPNLNENSKLLCMIGSFTIQKDQPTIIKAMKYVPENVHLILVGEGSLKKQNQDLVKSLSLENRVHFLGIRNDVSRILKTSDIVILSSNWEGFGLAAVEGMAAGKPVIASDVLGLGDIVKGSGITFKKGNSLELANAINNLLNDPDIYNKVATACFEKSKQYDINTMVKKYIDIYRSVLS